MSYIVDFYKILPTFYKKKFYQLFFIVILITVLETISIAAVIPILKLISSPDFFYQKEFSNINFFFIRSDNLYLFFTAFIFFFFIIKTLILIFCSFYQNKIIFSIYEFINQKIIKINISQDYNSYLKKSSYYVINLLNIETQQFISGVVFPFVVLLVEAMVLISIFIFLITFNYLIALMIAFIAFCAFLIYYFFFNKKTLSLGIKREFYENLKSKYLVETLGAIKEIKISLKEDFFLSKFNKSMSKVCKSQYFQKTLVETPKFVIELAGISSICFVFYFFFLNDKNNELIVLMGLFALAGLRILPSLNRIISSYQAIKFNYSVVKTIYNELNSQKINNVIQNNNVNFQIKNELIFKNVDFKYDNSNLLFQNLNFKILKGEMIAITGESGSGKSTFVDLVAGLLEPIKGLVLVDNQNIKLNKKSWINEIGYMPQTTFLNDDKIINNIAFGVDDKEILKDNLDFAIKNSNLTDVIKNLPDGINTCIGGENGIRLSAGQVQRIGIARILYSNKNFLIFDEATSALDENNELEIFKTILNLKKKKTILFVTHSTNILSGVDKIFELKKGIFIKI
jgi:ABC-type multidrug transport system fused ATPase/permease subunit